MNKTFAAIEKLKEVELELHRLKNALEMMNKAYDSKREWQGLTDEEIREFEIWLDEEEEKHGWNPPADIVKYLEAKLREKNNA